MKKNYTTLLVMAYCFLSFGQTKVFINEIHYENEGIDVNEGVEIAGPSGTDLSTYTLTLYNGKNNSYYKTIKLSGIIADQSNEFGTIFFPITGLQNGSPDGIALDNNGILIQFLSYEGTITASEGIANGVTSIDINVSENNTTAVGYSLQLSGTGNTYEDFSWSSSKSNSYNTINIDQTFSTTAGIKRTKQLEIQLYPNPTSSGIVYIKSLSQAPVFVELYNAIGSIVLSKKINNILFIDVKDLPTGIYMARIRQNNNVYTKKIVIK
jgi:hypothetical protein